MHPTSRLADSQRTEKINLDFGRAINAWNRHEWRDAVDMFRQHMKDYPDSPWAAEAELHVGCDATYHERYSEAEQCFQDIIAAQRNNADPGGKMLLNKARQRLALVRVAQNQPDAAAALFGELKVESPDWRHRTYAAHWLQRLSRQTAGQAALMDCGKQAIAMTLESLGRHDEARRVRATPVSSRRGQNLRELIDLAGRHGVPMQARELSLGELDAIPLPAVVHVQWNVPSDSGHYWLLEKQNRERLGFYDPQSKRRFDQSRAEFSGCWSGKVLVFAKPRLPGRGLTDSEMLEIHGSCCGAPHPEDHLGKPTYPSPPPGNPCGAPVWQVNVINMNMVVSDIPLWYEPGIGPKVNLALTYNSESAIARYEPFGNKWAFDLGSYLITDTAGQVIVFMPDGRRDVYMPDIATVEDSHLYLPQSGSGVHNQLVKLGTERFELRFPQGGSYLYERPAGTGSLQPFLVEVRDPVGQKLVLQYNSSAQLTNVVDAEGRNTSFTYSNGLCTRVTDPFGRFASFEYDASGNLVRITDMGGYASDLSYDADAYVTSMGNERGTWRFYTEPSGPPDPSASDTYPAPGAGMWENYRITITNPQGGQEEYFYYGGAANIYLVPERVMCNTFTWHVSPSAYLPWLSADINNYYVRVPKTMYWLDSYGRIAEIGYPDDNSIDYYYAHWSDEPTPVFIKDVLGEIRGYSYDELGQISSITNPGSYFYDTGQNQIVPVANPTGSVTRLTYSNKVDLVAISNVLGVVRAVYNTNHLPVLITDTATNSYQYRYDPYGHLTNYVDARGIGTEVGYGPDNRVQRVRRAGITVASFTYDGYGRLRTISDANGRAMTNSYNLLDMRTGASYPDGSAKSWLYSSCCPRLLDAVVDEAGRRTAYEYDGMKQLTRAVLPDGGALGVLWDNESRIVEVSQDQGRVTRYGYSSTNRLCQSETDALGATMRGGWDAAGHLRALTNCRGQAVTYDYNSWGKVTRKAYNGVEQVRFGYDSVGRLANVVHAGGTNVFSYDNRSLLRSIVYPRGMAITNSFDAGRNLTAVDYPGGLRVAYAYDAFNRVTNVSWGSEWVSLQYDGAGKLLREQRSNGTGTDYAYDARYRMTNLLHTSSTGQLARVSIQRDVLGHPATIDLTSQVTAAAPPAQTKSGRVNEANELVTWGTNNLQFDADGNMTNYASGTWSGMYDAENRLVQWVRGGVTNTCLYDSGGNRIRLTSGSTTKWSYFDTVPRLLFETDNNGQVTAWNIYIGKRLLARRGPSNQTVFYHPDNLGSTLLLTDGFGTVVKSYAYDVWGGIAAQSGSYSNNPFTFIGTLGVQDEGNGLFLMRARHYDAELGRFIERDPVGMAGGINLYGYTGNQPLFLVDPDGTFGPFGLVVGGVGGAIGGAITGGYSGGWWGAAKGAFVGGAVGAAVGAVGPLAAGLVGESVELGLALESGLGMASSALGQVGGNWANGECAFKNFSVGAMIGGGVGGGFSSILEESGARLGMSAYNIARTAGATALVETLAESLGGLVE